MKTIILFLFLSAGLCAQNVIYNSAIDSGTTTGTTVTFARNLFLTAVVSDSAASDSVYFQAYENGKWITITKDDGNTYYVKVSATDHSAVGLEPKYFYGFKTIRARITDVPARRVDYRLTGSPK